MRAIRTDEYVSALLHKGNAELSKQMKADIVVIRSPIAFGLDQVVRQEIDNLHPTEDDRSSRLGVLLETSGGHIEVVERIYGVFRKHYKTVSFIVPDYAYSAGTVLVLSGDEIYMDYYSILGPIDPQIQSASDRERLEIELFSYHDHHQQRASFEALSLCLQARTYPTLRLC